MRRRVFGWISRRPWWVQLGLAGAVLICSLNLTVAWIGGSAIFPLSPFFLREKAQALGAYLLHRPGCLLGGDDELAPLIERASRRHRLPPGLLAALVEVESEGRVHRISPAGAMGPGQLMPDTAELLGVDDPFDPGTAVDGSARYLAEQLQRFHGDLRLALAAYNAGPGGVHGAVPQNGETEFYVRKVLREYERRRQLPGKPQSGPRPASLSGRGPSVGRGGGARPARSPPESAARKRRTAEDHSTVRR